MGKIKTDELEERVGSAGITVNSTVKIDTITEKTSANGVSIDGVKLKDSIVEVDTINESTSTAGVTIDSVLLKDGAVVGAALTDYVETDVAVTSGTTLAIDLANGNTGSVTLAHSVTDIDFTNVPTDGTSSFTLKVTQDGTGSRTMAINAITVNGGSDATGLTSGNAGITLSTAANSVDLVTFLFFDAGTPLINANLDFKNS
jgi:hypothetical protein